MRLWSACDLSPLSLISLLFLTFPFLSRQETDSNATSPKSPSVSSPLRPAQTPDCHRDSDSDHGRTPPRSSRDRSPHPSPSFGDGGDQCVGHQRGQSGAIDGPQVPIHRVQRRDFPVDDLHGAGAGVPSRLCWQHVRRQTSNACRTSFRQPWTIRTASSRSCPSSPDRKPQLNNPIRELLVLMPPYLAFLSTNRPRQCAVQTCVMRFHSLRLGRLCRKPRMAGRCSSIP